MPIGLLNESSLHASLKEYIEPDETKYEIPYNGYIVDILRDDGVVEIQTASFGNMKKKLAALLECGYVTIVYPVAKVKRIYWQDMETGEITGGKLSPKHAQSCEIFKELRWISGFIWHKNLRIRIITIESAVYNRMDGYGKDKKKRASRIDKQLVQILDDFTISSADELTKLLPDTLPEEFTVKDAAKCGKIKKDVAQSGVKMLFDLGLLDRRPDGRSYIYKRKQENL